MSAETSGQTSVVVHLPEGLPVLTPEVCRILLAILVKLTTVEVLDGEGDRDC